MTASPDDRTPEVADAASTPVKRDEVKSQARKAPVRKPPAKRAPARTAAQNAAATAEEVARPAAKAADSADGPAKKPSAAAVRAAAAKNSSPRTPAKAAARSTTGRTAAAKSTSGASKSPARPTTSAAAKAAAAKAAAERATAAKTTARSAAAKRNTAKTAAAVTAAKSAAARSAAAKKAAAAKAAEAAEAENAAQPLDETMSEIPVQAPDADVDDSTAVPHEDDSRLETLVEDEPEAEEAVVVEDPAVADALVEEVAPVEVVAPVEEEAPIEVAPAEVAPIEDAAPDVDQEEPPVADADEQLQAEELIEEIAEPVVDAGASASASDTPPANAAVEAIRIRGLVKNFGDQTAVNGIDLTVPAGSFYGIVGPNGAGKTTTLSIVAGLLRADAGSIVICGIDQSTQPLAAKRVMGVLPDRLRTFDRLTGRQLLYYYGLLRGLAANVIEKRVADLARAFDLGDALSRVVSDYSAGMTKKIMLAGAMIHSPRVLVLDEPFEAVDPVSSAVILDILRAYVAHGGTVILSSHGMDLVERVCSRVAIIVGGDVLAEGTIDDVRAGQTLESRFVELAGSGGEVEGLEWLHTFSD